MGSGRLVGCEGYLIELVQVASELASCPCERSSVLVVVADQKSRSFAKWCRLSQLLGCPLVRRVPRHTKMHHTPRAQLDDDEHERCAEEEVIRLEEIADPYLCGVVAQERHPGLFRRTRRFAHVLDVFLNRAFADLHLQFQQFSPGVCKTWGRT
jgi:hypothetical protein